MLSLLPKFIFTYYFHSFIIILIKMEDLNNLEHNDLVTNIEQNENDMNDFFERTTVGETIKNIDNLEIQFKSASSVDESINIRVRQLAYAKILVNIYEKSPIYLIRAHANLGITYLENDYLEQAQEHLLNAFKLNENSSDTQGNDLKELQVTILINLAKCYLAFNKPNPSISISEKCLKMNKALRGEEDLSNADIYYVIAKGNTAIKNFDLAIEYFSKMFTMYEQIYSFDSEKCARVCMELGQIYELNNKPNEALEYFSFSWEIWEKVISKNNSENENSNEILNEDQYLLILEVAIKIAELNEKSDKVNDSYAILKSCESKYISMIPKKKQLELKKHLVKYSELCKDLELSYKELIEYEVRIKL